MQRRRSRSRRDKGWSSSRVRGAPARPFLLRLSQALRSIFRPGQWREGWPHKCLGTIKRKVMTSKRRQRAGKTGGGPASNNGNQGVTNGSHGTGSVRSRWGWIATQPLSVQIVGGLIVAGVVAGIGYLLANSWAGDVEPKASRQVKLKSSLPDMPLGEALLFFLVESAPAGQREKRQAIQGRDLEVRAGVITVHEERSVVSHLGIFRVSDGQELIAGRNVALSGDYMFSTRAGLNCSFRVDVMASKELFNVEKFIISLESWDLKEGQPSCPIRFGGDRVWAVTTVPEG
jgi:hypothetical protein